MKKLLITTVLTALIAIFFNSGCVLTPRESHPTGTYDLVMKPGQAQNMFKISVFVNNTPSHTKMLYRKSGGRIEQDEYNRWVQSPEQMLQRYFLLAFPLDGNADIDKLGDLRCNVTAFEFDWEKSEAVLALNYTLRDYEGNMRTGSLCITEKAATHTPGGFAEAMSRAVANAAGKISAVAKSMAAAN